MEKIVAILVVLAVPVMGSGQDLLVPHQHHEWARFPAGSWKQVRQVKQSFKDGELRSSITTTTKVRLKSVGPDYIVLEQESKSEVSGQVFEKPLRELKTGINGQYGEQTVHITPGGKEKLEILGRVYLCELRNTESQSDEATVIGKVFYHPSTSPFILRREFEFTANGQEKPERKTVSQVIAVDKPYPVLSEIKSVAFIVQNSRSLEGSVETVEAQCSEVPGFVVGTWSTTYDEQGQVTEKLVVELLNYEIAPNSAQTSQVRSKGIFRNRRRRIFDESVDMR